MSINDYNLDPIIRSSKMPYFTHRTVKKTIKYNMQKL